MHVRFPVQLLKRIGHTCDKEVNHSKHHAQQSEMRRLLLILTGRKKKNLFLNIFL